MQPENTLLILGKLPTAGNVKTRLAPALGTDRACRVHLECLRTVLGQTRALGSGIRVVLAGTPDDSRKAFEACLGESSGHIGFRSQGPGDLGDRLERLFEAAFHDGSRQVVAIGTDSPHQAVMAVTDALEALDSCDLVLGPAEDGGYYLIGLGAPCPGVFQGIDWGTEHVTRQTLARAERLGRRVKLLRVGYDLDRPEDLGRLMKDLAVVEDNPALIDLRDKLKALLSGVPDWPGGSI